MSFHWCKFQICKSNRNVIFDNMKQSLVQVERNDLAALQFHILPANIWGYERGSVILSSQYETLLLQTEYGLCFHEFHSVVTIAFWVGTINISMQLRVQRYFDEVLDF